MLRLYIDNNQDKINVDKDLEKLVDTVIKKALEYEGVNEKCEVNLMFVDNDEIKEINSEQRNIDNVTDVLSFPMLDAKNGEIKVSESDFFEGYLVLGDIVISLERAKEQAEEFGHSFFREVGFLTCHSILHLLGYDHMEDDDRMIMRKKEEDVLSLLELTRE
ncbi:MAG: rRNA maturation RNase YbeY [Ruminococcaceae bacterium]|nr:rRNA maturation RNase YbeY [Oscillospiraceae bacterium]